MENYSSYLERINNCEPEDSLLSQTPLGSRLEKIPLTLLNHADLSEITQALNLKQLIPNLSGLSRDYRGIAELMGFSLVEIRTKFKRAYNPTRSLIDAFISKDPQANLNTLVKMIETIERFDVLDDFLPNLIKLASIQFNEQQQHHHQRQQLQHPLNFRSQLSAIEQNESLDNETISTCNGTPNLVNDLNRLTFHDNACSIIHYDAFICFAPEDCQYAQELIYSLEERGAKVATADDLLPGHFEHEALMRLIDVRCRKVIIILTPNFSKSKECEFQTKFASEVGFKTRVTKIIPVVYETLDDSTLPRMIQVSTKIDMNCGQRQWQLERLIRALELDQGSHYIRHFASSNNKTRKHKIQNLDNSQSPVPAITFSETNSMTSNFSSNEPIVDLLHSEDLNHSKPIRSKELNTSESVVYRKNPSPTSNHSSGNPKTWLVESVRKIFGNSSSSTPSQTGLLAASPDLSSEEGLQNS